MAIDILSRYGIKEVADVTFYELVEEEGKALPGAPVLYLDTLKVSTIEQTAENTSARGGKGNPELIMWDYGKEITVTLEDALFSAKSMALMYGVKPEEIEGDLADIEIRKTVRPEMYDKAASTFKINGESVKVTDPKEYNAQGEDVSVQTVTDKEVAYVTAKLTLKSASKIVISSDKFPGTYYVTGDTYARSESTGKDEFFQFIIPKAKMQSEVTLTMEAEGDPSTFNMNLKVLRPADGEMMKLVKYSLSAATQEEAEG